MNTAFEVTNISRSYKSVVALDDVSLGFEQDVIHGLLGRNGAGKTSLMSIAAGQDWPDRGEVSVFGARPHENDRVLPRICFVREDQRYIDDSLPRHAFKGAAMSFPNWDQQLAERLVEEFQVPLKTRIKKMSRGQRSAVGVIIGIASRADLTFFDEPYMGLDAVSRQLFYDRLLADYADHPRTIVLSSHLIDEIAHLIENVVLIDKGSILIDEPVENLRDRAVTLVGPSDNVREIVGFREVLHREDMGRLTRVTVLGALEDREKALCHEIGVEVLPVSLQQLVVRLTAREPEAGAGSPDFNHLTSEVSR